MAGLSGVITAMATPFSDDGSVDLDSARRLAVHLVDTGSDGLVVAGTTGESPTLDDTEKLSLLDAVIGAVDGGVPVICGSGSNDTAHSVNLSQQAAEAGADALLVVCPYYNRPNRRGILAHFSEVAGAVEIPVVVYNIPARTGTNIPPDLLEELGSVRNITAVKQANDAEIQAVPGLDLLAGNDGTFLQCLEAGGVGGILVASHLVAGRLKAIFDLFAVGDTDGARRANSELEPLFEALSVTTNPIPLKAALDITGLCAERMRLPLVSATDEEREVVGKALRDLGLVEDEG